MPARPSLCSWITMNSSTEQIPGFRLIPVFVILFILIFSISLSAGTITPRLEERIAAADGNEFIRVIVKPVSIHNPTAMRASLTALYKTRADRHRAGIDRLKAAAEISQQPIVNSLLDAERNKQARRVKSFWIINLIEAELTVASIKALVSNRSIERINLYPEIIPISSYGSVSASENLQGVKPNLQFVKADSAWAAGYDGRGRIVCNFDTGVEGDHPALIDNYRGNKGYPASQCWFSRTDSSTFPHTFEIPHLPSTESHGTHTMGIIVGHDDAEGDTIGVAPGADWIAAVAINVAGSSIFEAFQWAADPDGDPNTVSDIPDVINHSWGVVEIGCSDIFWEVIDNIEALGVVNIFAAGNEGPDTMSIVNPANRADDSLTCFAVGAVDSDDDTTIYYRSSRGPSECNIGAVKPNVVAPGVNIVSSIPEDPFYVVRSGTSMAAPHVAGAVAILRQKNPDATVDDIKTAILNSAYDLGTEGPDNDFGWGLIDIMEALRQIEPITEQSLEVARLEYPVINPGDSVSVELALKNIGASADNVTAQFSNPDYGLTIHTGQINYGDINRDSISAGDSTLDLKFDEAVETGKFLSLDMDIYIEGGYYKQQRLSFLVGERGERNYFNHETGRIKFTISNYGAFGFGGTSLSKTAYGSYIPLGFRGFQIDRDTNDLYEASLMIGIDSAHVSDCARNIAQEPDNDFAVIHGGSIRFFTPGPLADQETVSSFDDRYAENPLGLTIRQKSYSWLSTPDDMYIILEYIITNNSGEAINGLRVGLFLDWNITEYINNRGAFLPDRDLGYLYWSDGSDSAEFRGVRILNPEGTTNHWVYINSDEIYGSNFHEGRKYQGLSDDSRPAYTFSNNIAHITSAGPFDMADGQSDTVAFAIIGENNWSQFLIAADRAKQKYDDFPTSVDDFADRQLPGKFTLDQNYPNPFNPATTISFAIPQAGNVRLDIFDILGRKVKTLINSKLPAGRHTLVWDGADKSGRPVASGIYFFRVQYSKTSLTRAMLLLK
jgi:subtilisin family serine protease